MMHDSAEQVRVELHRLASLETARVLQGFFKTGPGEYGHGDLFLGIKVPASREVAKAHRDLSLPQVKELLTSTFHEERLTALLILIQQFTNAGKPHRKKIFDLYLCHTRFINNWDLVDLSAAQIVGAHLADKPRDLLYTLARSKLLWDRRIAIIATYHFIKNMEFAPTLKLARMLLNDDHDLIHKAIGWMLREIGKRDLAVEKQFLKAHHHHLPRTSLRYAIERFPQAERRRYLQGDIPE